MLVCCFCTLATPHRCAGAFLLAEFTSMLTALNKLFRKLL